MRKALSPMPEQIISTTVEEGGFTHARTWSSDVLPKCSADPARQCCFDGLILSNAE